MSCKTNPLLEVSTNFLYKSLKNGLMDRSRTLSALKNGAPAYRRSIKPSDILSKKIVSKTESQLQRLYKKLYKQNKGDLEKTEKEWLDIWKRLQSDANPITDYKDPIISRQLAKETDARDLRSIIDPIANIERKYHLKG